MPHSYTNLLVHLVFATKERRPWLAPEVLPRVLGLLTEEIRTQGAIPLEVNGVADHVHILTKVRQDRALSDFMRDVKACSSQSVHALIPELAAFAWQRGYGAFSVSQSQVEVVRAYIRN